MGQPLPLPTKIPVPSSNVISELGDMGITIEDSQQTYSAYRMPDGWKMVDRSWRQDLPKFSMVDTDNNIRVTISGAWKETYDNDITLRVQHAPFEKFVHDPSAKIIPSETSVGAIITRYHKAMIENPNV
jgi:hypothetical protein